MAAQRNLVRHFQRLSVDDVQRAVGLITDVEPASVGSSRSSMVYLDACYLSDDFVRCWIDNADVVTGRVGLNDPDLAGDRGRTLPADPCRESLPFGIVLRLAVLASVVSGVTTRFLCERMQQQFALRWIAGHDSCPNHVEVLSRFFVIPRGVPWRNRLQSHGCAG